MKCLARKKVRSLQRHASREERSNSTVVKVMPAIQPSSAGADNSVAWKDYLDLRAIELAFLSRRVGLIFCFPLLILVLGLLVSNYPQNAAIVLLEIVFVAWCLFFVPQYTSESVFAFVKARAEGIATVLQVVFWLCWNFIASSSLRQVVESFESCKSLSSAPEDEHSRIYGVGNFTEMGSSLIRVALTIERDYCHDTHALMALYISLGYVYLWAQVYEYLDAIVCGKACSVMLCFAAPYRSGMLLALLILRPARFRNTAMMVVLPGVVLCGQIFAAQVKWGARPLLYCLLGTLMFGNVAMLLWVPHHSGRLRFANFLHKRQQSLKIKRAVIKVAEVEAQNEKMVLRLQEATSEIKKVMAEGGKVLAAYEVRSTDIAFGTPVRKLGEGSFGTVVWAVYRGEHEVAVKTMRVSKVSESVLTKFKSEIIASSLVPLTLQPRQIMAPLHHPNLVRLFGGVWNEGADKLCIVLEFCGNGSLKTFLAEDSGTWEGLRYGLALGIANGLRYLHHDLKEPLIHRDVKPDNILIGEGTVAKLADFGESTTFDTERAKKDADASGEDALSMTMVGTQYYCAPEIMARERYNESVDTFSFALVLLCLAVGKIDFIVKKAVITPTELHYLGVGVL